MPRTLYDEDFYLWTQQMAEAVRSGNWAELDRENIAEEIESLGKRDRRGVVNRLTVLITHLLKWEYQPERRSRSWRSTIDEQRSRLKLILKDSPSLDARMDEFLAEAYPRARRKAAEEMRLIRNTIPERCRMRLDFILSEPLSL
jgi:hypothetical protein